MWPHSEWTAEDRVLALALRIRTDRLCPCGCGFPRDLAWDEMADGWFEVEEKTCFARKARDMWEREHAQKQSPGTILVTVDTRND